MNRNSIIKHRIDGLVLIDGTDCNPNGDPDRDGAPRLDEHTSHALLSPQATHRRIRDRSFQMFDGEGRWGIHIRRDATIEDGILAAAEKAGVEVKAADPEETKDKNGKNGKKKAVKYSSDDRNAVSQSACDMFFDDRMFGGVLNVGKVRGANINGVVSTMMGRSIYPLEIARHALTRVSATSDEQDKDQEMGSMFKLPHVALTQAFFINPFHAKQNGATMEDLAVYLDCLVNLYENKRSNFGGMMSVRGIWLFRHDSPLGNAPAHTLLDRLDITCDDPASARSLKDYSVQFNDSGLPPGITVFQIEQLMGGVDNILKTLDAA